MPFTIWRGGRLLGTIVIPFRGDPSRGVAGILKTDSGLDGIAPIIQGSLDHLPGAPVIQSPPSRSRVAVLRELSAQELEGVPAELRLEVQDDQGQPVLIKLITIDHFELPSPGEGDLAEACRTNGLHGRGWVASVLFADSNVSVESRAHLAFLQRGSNIG